MKIRVDINSPNSGHHDVDWPEGTPVPAVGDHVMWRRQQITWSFDVTGRVMGIGVDMANGGLMTHLSLDADSEAPEGFETHLRHPPASR